MPRCWCSICGRRNCRICLDGLKQDQAFFRRRHVLFRHVCKRLQISLLHLLTTITVNHQAFGNAAQPGARFTQLRYLLRFAEDIKERVLRNVVRILGIAQPPSQPIHQPVVMVAIQIANVGVQQR